MNKEQLELELLLRTAFERIDGVLPDGVPATEILEVLTNTKQSFEHVFYLKKRRQKKIDNIKYRQQELRDKIEKLWADCDITSQAKTVLLTTLEGGDELSISKVEKSIQDPNDYIYSHKETYPRTLYDNEKED